MAMAMETLVRSFKGKKNILAFPASSLELGCPNGEVCEGKTNKIAGIGNNILRMHRFEGAHGRIDPRNPQKEAMKMKPLSHLPEHWIVILRCGGKHQGDF